MVVEGPAKALLLEDDVVETNPRFPDGDIAGNPVTNGKPNNRRKFQRETGSKSPRKSPTETKFRSTLR